MKTEELILQLQLKGITGGLVAGIGKDGRTYSVEDVECEYHEDATSVATIWLRLDEN